MQAEFDHPRSDVLIVVSVVWIAGLLTVLAGLLVYLADRGYDPVLTCDELGDKVFTGGAITDLDAWDDYELLCHDGYGRPTAP